MYLLLRQIYLVFPFLPVKDDRKGFFGRLSYLAVTAEADETVNHDEL
jgi:hypothetical protein